MTPSDQLDEEVFGIASGGDGHLVCERTDTKGVVDVGYRAHPANADVIVGWAVLDAQVWDVVWHVLETVGALDSRAIRIFPAVVKRGTRLRKNVGNRRRNAANGRLEERCEEGREGAAPKKAGRTAVCFKPRFEILTGGPVEVAEFYVILACPLHADWHTGKLPREKCGLGAIIWLGLAAGARAEQRHMHPDRVANLFLLISAHLEQCLFINPEHRGELFVKGFLPRPFRWLQKFPQLVGLPEQPLHRIRLQQRQSNVVLGKLGTLRWHPDVPSVVLVERNCYGRFHRSLSEVGNVIMSVDGLGGLRERRVDVPLIPQAPRRLRRGN